MTILWGDDVNFRVPSAILFVFVVFIKNELYCTLLALVKLHCRIAFVKLWLFVYRLCAKLFT